MDKIFGRRNAEIRVVWGASGAQTEIADWSRELGIDSKKDRRCYNLEDGRRPRGGVKGHARILDPLREKGADPMALATWAETGTGEMPRPPRALRVQPDVRDPLPAPALAVEPARPVTKAVVEARLLADALADTLEDADELERHPEKLAEITRRMRARAQATLRKTGSLRWDSDPRPHHYESRSAALRILPSLKGPRKAAS